jgi:hypothetical protein
LVWVESLLPCIAAAGESGYFVGGVDGKWWKSTDEGQVGVKVVESSERAEFFLPEEVCAAVKRQKSVVADINAIRFMHALQCERLPFFAEFSSPKHEKNSSTPPSQKK